VAENPLSRLRQSLSAALIGAFLKRTGSRRPGAFNKGEHRPNVSVTENALKRRHVTLKTRSSHRLAPQLGDLEEKLIGMVPGMTGFIVWGSGKATCRKRFFPIRLAFEVGAMTAGAMLRINRLASRNLLGIARIRPLPGRIGAGGLGGISSILCQQTLNELMGCGAQHAAPLRVLAGDERLGRGLPGIFDERQHERTKSGWQARAGFGSTVPSWIRRYRLRACNGLRRSQIVGLMFWLTLKKFDGS
jgi:hypothetical protein